MQFQCIAEIIDARPNAVVPFSKEREGTLTMQKTGDLAVIILSSFCHSCVHYFCLVFLSCSIHYILDVLDLNRWILDSTGTYNVNEVLIVQRIGNSGQRFKFKFEPAQRFILLHQDLIKLKLSKGLDFSHSVSIEKKCDM